MAISFPNGSVTQTGWNVGRTLAKGIPAGGKLSVFKGFAPHRDKKGFPIARRGDNDGRTFQTEAEYESFVRSRGYVQPYFRNSAMFKAMNRANIRRWTAELVAAVMAAKTQAEIVALADRQKQIVRAHGCDILDAMAFGNAAYWIGRKFRPEIYPREWPYSAAA